MVNGIKSTPPLAAANNASQSSVEKEKTVTANNTKIAGALAPTALTILPEVLEIIKN